MSQVWLEMTDMTDKQHKYIGKSIGQFTDFDSLKRIQKTNTTPVILEKAVYDYIFLERKFLVVYQSCY